MSVNNKRSLPPFIQHLGCDVVEWEKNHVVLTVDVRPEFCNNSGIAHGGFISTLIDSATGMAGVYCPNPENIRKALTLSLHTNFLGQAEGNKLKVVGSITSSGRKIFYATADVYDYFGNHIASGQAVCRYRSGSEDIQGQPINS